MIEITKKEIKLAKGIAGNLCKRWGGCLNEDIEGYAMVGLMEAAKTFDGRGTFKGWLSVRVKQVIIDHFRHDCVDLRFYEKPEYFIYRESPDFVNYKGILDYKTYPFSNSEWLNNLSNDGLENRLCAKDFLEKAITLNNTEKKILKFRLNGKSGKQIAEIMSMNINTVWNNFSSGSKKLKEAWYAS